MQYNVHFHVYSEIKETSATAKFSFLHGGWCYNCQYIMYTCWYMHGLQSVIYRCYNLLQMEGSRIQSLHKQSELLHKLYYYCVQEHSRNMCYFCSITSLCVDRKYWNVLEAQVVYNQLCMAVKVGQVNTHTCTCDQGNYLAIYRCCIVLYACLKWMSRVCTVGWFHAYL